MKPRRTSIGLAALAALAMMAGCSRACSQPSSNDDDAEEADDDDDNDNDDDDKPDKKARGDETAKPGASVAFDSELFGDPYGDAFGNALDLFDNRMFGAVQHSEIEPSSFSSGWVGREAHEVLQRARKKEFDSKTVRAGGQQMGKWVCLVFLDRGIARRTMLAARGEPSEEMAYSARGDLILWYRHNRRKPSYEDWGYFHRGNNLMLYQVRDDMDPRQTKTAPASMREAILRNSQNCLTAGGARNPRPGSQPTQPPAQPPTPDPGGGGGGGGKHFGALAFSESTSAWRVAYSQTSDDAARQAALGGCQPSDCQIRASFGRGECISVGKGNDKYVAWGWAAGNNAAQTRVMTECGKRGYTRCEIQGTWCNEP